MDLDFIILNQSFKSLTTCNFFPFNWLQEKKKSLDQASLQIIDSFVLLLNEKNLQVLESKRSLYDYFRHIMKQVQNFEYFLFFSFLFISQKQKQVSFSHKWATIFQETIQEHIPLIFSSNQQQNELILSVFYILHELKFLNPALLDQSILQLIQDIQVFKKPDIWSQMLETINTLNQNPFLKFHFSTPHEHKMVKDTQDIFQFFIQGHYLLFNQSIKKVLDFFNDFSKNSPSLSVNNVFNISKKLEPFLKYKYLLKKEKVDYLAKLRVVFRGTFKYLSVQNGHQLLFVQKSLLKHNQIAFISNSLQRLQISIQLRVKLWLGSIRNQISLSNKHIHKSCDMNPSVKQKMNDLIQLDVN